MKCSDAEICKYVPVAIVSNIERDGMNQSGKLFFFVRVAVAWEAPDVAFFFLCGFPIVIDTPDYYFGLNIRNYILILTNKKQQVNTYKLFL